MNRNSAEYKKLRRILVNLRFELEDEYGWEYNKRVFTGKCHDISEIVTKLLNKNGFNAEMEYGMVSRTNPSYRQRFTSRVKPKSGEWAGPTSHWWVTVNDKYIVDLTQDQFHPEKEDSFRIILTDIKNKYYINEDDPKFNNNDWMYY